MLNDTPDAGHTSSHTSGVEVTSAIASGLSKEK